MAQANITPLIPFATWIDRPTEQDYYGIVEARSAQHAINLVKAKVQERHGKLARCAPIVQELTEQEQLEYYS